MPRDFDTALQQADATLQARGMPRDAKLRLDARLFAPPPQRLAMTLVAAVSVAVGFVVVAWLAPRPPPMVGGFTVTAAELGHVQVSAEAAVTLAEGSAMLDEARGLKVSSLDASTLRKETRGVRILNGRATFEVQKVTAGRQPVRVLVSGGAIEVRGTRFTVTERGAGGEVLLHEGQIVFLGADGLEHRVQPGETFAWPLPGPPPPPPELDELEPLPPLRPRQTTKSQEIDWREFDRRVHAEAVITELTQLRRSGAWTDAVKLLERELSRGAPDTRERLSFELGLIYAWQLKDSAAACAHWAQHRQEYPGGRFAAEVERAAATLGCAP
ncbi:MAG: FecR domain-containing protein [Archangium sp.]|nr:FecR domain-containing protein [Archangium sp.]